MRLALWGDLANRKLTCTEFEFMRLGLAWYAGPTDTFADWSSPVDSAQDMYLDLMMRSLTDWLYDDFDESVRTEGLDWPARRIR